VDDLVIDRDTDGGRIAAVSQKRGDGVQVRQGFARDAVDLAGGCARADNLADLVQNQGNYTASAAHALDLVLTLDSRLIGIDRRCVTGPERWRLAEGGQDLRVGMLDTDRAIDGAQQPLALIIPDQRRRFFLVDTKPVADRLGTIVLPLHERTAAVVADALALRVHGLDVINAITHGAHPPPRETADQFLLRDHQVENSVERLAQRGQDSGQTLGLRQRPRKAVEDKPLRAIALLEPLLHHLHDQIVGDQVPSIHIALGPPAQWRASAPGRTQHVAGSQMGQVPLGRELSSLGALARARRPQQNQPRHFMNPS